MYAPNPRTVAALIVFVPSISFSQVPSARRIVAVLAHPDDEGPSAPALARYARDGVEVHLLIATAGGQGTGFAAARGETSPSEHDLVRMRTEEAACSAKELGVKPPIMLGFPDGKLGDYIGESAARRTAVDPTRSALYHDSRCVHTTRYGGRHALDGVS